MKEIDNVHIACRIDDYDFTAEGDSLPEALAVLAIQIRNTVTSLETQIRVLNMAAERVSVLGLTASHSGEQSPPASPDEAENKPVQR